MDRGLREILYLNLHEGGEKRRKKYFPTLRSRFERTLPEQKFRELPLHQPAQ